MFRDKKIICVSLLQIMFVIPSAMQSQDLNQESRGGECRNSTIRFDDSSIEKLIMHPEDVIADPEAFWESDPAYQLVKQWHRRVSLPVEMEKWEGEIRSFQNLSVEEREKNSQLIAARKMAQQETEFNEKAVSFLCSFLPHDCPDISTTIFFTTAIVASGFQIDDNIVIYGANADKDNLMVHELFHQGFNKYRQINRDADSTADEIYYELQNEGMATYVGYKGLKEFPGCRTDLLKDDYKLFANQEEVIVLLKRMNKILEKSPTMEEKELKDSLWQAGSIDRGYYVVGCFMAKRIDEELGREALVSTIVRGPRSFLQTYNSLVDDKLRIHSLFR